MGYSFTVLKFVFVPTFGNEFGPFVYDRVTGLNYVKFLGDINRILNRRSYTEWSFGGLAM